MDEWYRKRIMALADRISALESQVGLLSAQAGIAYTAPPSDGVPPEVVALARAGKKMDAIKMLRASGILSLEEAKEIVEGL